MNNKKSKIKLLIITAYYPPIISVASQRLHAIAKYIDKSLFDVYVFFPYSGKDVKNDDNVTLIPIKINSWLRYANFNKKTSFLLHKIKSLWNRLLISLGVSHYYNFEQQVFYKVSSIVGNESFVILSSSPPIEVHKAALKIKKHFRKAIWLSDLRDALSNNPYIPVNQRNKHYFIEKLILQNADAITSVSMPIVLNLEAKNVRKIPIAEVRNGFDFEAKLKIHFNEQFTMLHAGTFYADRKPNTLFLALENLIKKGLIDDFRLIFIGQSSGIKIPTKFISKVEELGKINYSEAVNLMQLADALLLIHPPSEYKGVYTGKLFDYLGAMRPIIALVDKDDVAAALIQECNAGYVANFYNIEEIEQVILNAYQLWKNKKTLPYNSSLIYMHHRAYQVKIFEHIIHKIINGKP